MKNPLIGAMALAFVSGTAAAEAFKVGDLGEMPSRRICMDTAAKVLGAYIDEFGGRTASGEVDVADSWVYFAWDLRPGNIDVVITCPVVDGQVNAFFTLYSSAENELGSADTAAVRIRELWERHY